MTQIEKLNKFFEETREPLIKEATKAYEEFLVYGTPFPKELKISQLNCPKCFDMPCKCRRWRKNENR